MSTINENDDEELVIIETDDEGNPPEPEAEQSDAPDEDDDDDGDARLAESDDDHEAEISTGNRERRRKRRDMQRRAREAAQRELEILRQNNAIMAQRLAAVEGRAFNSDVQNVDARLNETVAQIRQAEAIMARATEAGNGDDVVAAMRIRDQAMAEAQQLQYSKQQMLQYAQQQAQAQQQPQVDPNVVNYARQWVEANPWYDPNGGDRDSALTKGIDNELAREGYNPASREYWEELTSRVAEALGEAAPAAASSPRRKAPPQGGSRQHAPTSTRKEVYVTPERKAAMIEAGVWDDPVQRNRMLKAYQEYDKNSSAR